MMYDPDKNQALTIVIEKLTEIVDNINQDEQQSTSAKPSRASSPQTIITEDVDMPPDTAETVEISTDHSTPHQVIINLPVKVGNVNIVNTEGLLESLKQLDERDTKEVRDYRRVTELYQCSKCDYSSHNKHYLKQHVDLVHTTERPFKCPLCDYAGKRSHSLKEHLVVHSPYRPFMCPFCSASFRKKGHLTNHIKLHASEQAIACSICKHFISNRSELSRHLRQAHVGGEVFTCEQCDYATTSENNMLMHTHSHGNATVYSCTGCKFIGFDEEVLKTHVLSHHGGEGSFKVSNNTTNTSTKSGPVVLLKCSECGFTTNGREAMRSHMYQDHLETSRDAKLSLPNKPQATTESVSEKLAPTAVNPTLNVTNTDPIEVISPVHTEGDKGSETAGEESTVLDDVAVLPKVGVSFPPPNVSSTSATAISKLVYGCVSCSFRSGQKQCITEHMKRCHPSSLADQDPGESPGEEISVYDKVAETVIVASDDVGETENYSCTHCKYKCGEAMAFITHMLTHTPGRTATNTCSEDEGAAKAAEDARKLGFMQDPAAGIYCCLICGYTCDHQRTIKAHIWKHSGHRDVNYPTFQNGPISMYEEIAVGKQATDVTSPSTSDSSVIHVDNTSKADDQEDKSMPKFGRIVVVAPTDLYGTSAHDGKLDERTIAVDATDLGKESDGIETPSRKRKLSESAESEMDVSMPKMRVVDKEPNKDNVKVQSISNLYPSPRINLSVHSTPRGSPQSLSPQPHSPNEPEPSNVPEEIESTTVVNKEPPMEQESKEAPAAEKSSEALTEIVSEQVVETDNVVEVVVETSSQGDSKPVSLRALLQSQPSSHPDKLSPTIQYTTASKESSDNADKGISSSLLAVIEQFRKDASPTKESLHEANGNFDKIGPLYYCRDCDFSSPYVSGIKVHTVTHEDLQTKNQCSLCKFLTTSGQELQKHMLEHCAKHKKTTHQCKLCPGTFYSRNSLSAHMKLHDKVTEKSLPPEGSTLAKRCYVCENCEKSFTTVETLLMHKMDIVCWTRASELDEDILMCNFCDFVGMSVRSLKSHMKRHWNDMRAKHAQEHMPLSKYESSGDPKWFACERCTSVFDNIMGLLDHTATTCSVSQMPKCTDCIFVSANTELFKRHVNFHHNHGKMYKCQTCEFVSKSFNRMDSHVKRHIEPCDLHCGLCDFVATSVRSLKSHMKRHTNDQRFVRQPLEQYKCNMCGYICHHLPALKSHMWRHASETNYSYEKTNAVINAAIEDGSQSEDGAEKDSEDDVDVDVVESSQYSMIRKESEMVDNLIAFRCCHCFYETCIKKELNEHMKQHMDIIQKTMEVNNELFYKASCSDKEDMD